MTASCLSWGVTVQGPRTEAAAYLQHTQGEAKEKGLLGATCSCGFHSCKRGKKGWEEAH